jgi:hypothetical protein
MYRIKVQFNLIQNPQYRIKFKFKFNLKLYIELKFNLI